MAAGDACRSCRRGRCDLCDDPACCCPECGVEPVEASRYANGGIIPAGSGGVAVAMLTGCDYVIPRALAERALRDGPVPAF